MDQFSHSILGKFCAVMLIAYYTVQNLMYGLLFCIMVIYYYQMSFFTKSPVFFSDLGKENFENENIINNTKKENNDFLEKYCVDGKLKYKEYDIHSEMAEHVFPEVKSDGHSACNPCNPTCKFSISNNKLRTEEEIVKPKSSNEYFPDVMSHISKMF